MMDAATAPAPAYELWELRDGKPRRSATSTRQEAVVKGLPAYHAAVVVHDGAAVAWSPQTTAAERECLLAAARGAAPITLSAPPAISTKPAKPVRRLHTWTRSPRAPASPAPAPSAPAGPCEGCASRPTCTAPCEKLRLHLAPEELKAWEEVSSPSLMAGKGHDPQFMVQPEVEREEEPDEAGAEVDRLWERYRAVFPSALSRLTPSQREAIEHHLAGRSRTEVGKLKAVSRQAVHKAFHAALKALRAVLEPVSMAQAASPLAPSFLAPTPVLELSPGVTVQAVDVTPEVALALLEAKASNRPVDEAVVKRYELDLRAGAWRTTHQGLALDAEGRLIDGEHRLWAIVNAGIAARMLVTRGLTEADRMAFDAGKVRSVSDSLRLVHGKKAPPKGVVAWFRAIASLATGKPSSVSTHHVEAEVARYADSLAWARRAVPSRGPLARAPVVGALLYAHRVAPEATEAFAERFFSGAELTATAPELLLRGYLLERVTGRRDSTRVVSLKTLRALQVRVTGEPLATLRAGTEGLQYFTKLHQEQEKAINESR